MYKGCGIGWSKVSREDDAICLKEAVRSGCKANDMVIRGEKVGLIVQLYR